MTLDITILLTWQGERMIEFHEMWGEFYHHEIYLTQLSSLQFSNCLSNLITSALYQCPAASCT